jgi:hypothetical protein
MAMVFFNIQSVLPASSAGKTAGVEPKGPIQVQMRHGIPIYAVAKDSEKIATEFIDAGAHFLQEKSTAPVEFMVTLKNNGNVHVRPKGTIRIEGPLSEETELEWGWPILPTQKHTYFGKTKKTDWPAGTYAVTMKLETGQPHQAGLFVEKRAELQISDQGKMEFKLAP